MSAPATACPVCGSRRILAADDPARGHVDVTAFPRFRWCRYGFTAEAITERTA